MCSLLGVSSVIDDSSVLWWEKPELCVSLGEKGLMGLLPKMWVPVLSATGGQLPQGVELRRVVVSDTVGGLLASGQITMDPSQAVSMTRDGGGPSDGGRLRLKPTGG